MPTILDTGTTSNRHKYARYGINYANYVQQGTNCPATYQYGVIGNTNPLTDCIVGTPESSPPPKKQFDSGSVSDRSSGQRVGSSILFSYAIIKTSWEVLKKWLTIL